MRISNKFEYLCETVNLDNKPIISIFQQQYFFVHQNDMKRAVYILSQAHLGCPVKAGQQIIGSDRVGDAEREPCIYKYIRGCSYNEAIDDLR